MSSTLGTAYRISVFGESHGSAIGAVIDAPPPGAQIDLDAVRVQMQRRAPNGNKHGSTKRTEADEPRILSGVLPGDGSLLTLTGAPLCVMIENTNTRSADYANISRVARPSHADYTGYMHYNGCNDIRGGGHFSGRLTAPLVFAGAVAQQILAAHGIRICAHIASIGSVTDTPFDPCDIPLELAKTLNTAAFPVIDNAQGKLMQNEIERARMDADSIGGVVECAVTGLPAGLGAPIFDALESKIAHAVMGVPAVKGIAFGAGFSITAMRGSQANDAMRIENGRVVTTTNRNGGILGGITNGMPVLFHAAVKPTASIGLTQQSVDLQAMENTDLLIKGRHDACIVPRAVPVIEAAAAVSILDEMMAEGKL